MLKIKKKYLILLIMKLNEFDYQNLFFGLFFNFYASFFLFKASRVLKDPTRKLKLQKSLNVAFFPLKTDPQFDLQKNISQYKVI